MKKLFVIILIITVGLQKVNAQQQFMITQYMFNGLAMNPAYAGIHDGVSASFLTRHQWVGIEGAPTTQFFSIHSPMKYHPVSVGAVFYRDEIGVKKENTGYFSYAYRIGLTKKIRLSLGLQANMHQINQDFIIGAADDPNDPRLVDDSAMKFNAGSGFLIHSDRFYLGFSVPQLLKNKFGSQELSLGRLVQHMYVTGGYVFLLNNGVVFKPNFLLKAVSNAPISLDLNANFLLKNVLWVGVNHRWNESFAALFALQIGPRMQLGYSFDLNSNDLNSTSHELMINYIVDFPTKKILTPRYF